MKSSILWDVMPCSLLKVKLNFNTLHGVISQKMELHNHRRENLNSYNLDVPCQSREKIGCCTEQIFAAVFNLRRCCAWLKGPLIVTNS
jgi:hypothetical protein